MFKYEGSTQDGRCRRIKRCTITDRGQKFKVKREIKRNLQLQYLMISHTCSLSYLCSSWKAISSSDKTNVEGERIFQRDLICFSIPPWHPIGTAAPASGDEARPCLFGAKRGYLRFLEVLSRDLSLCRRMGRNTGRVYMSGRRRRRQRVMVQIRSRGGGEKDRKQRRKRRARGGQEWEDEGLYNLTGRYITSHYTLSLT